MIKIILPLVALLFCTQIFAQNSVQIFVKDSTQNKNLTGATVNIKSIKKISLTDSTGATYVNNLPNGTTNIEVSYTDYITQTIAFTAIADSIVQLYIYLQTEEEDLEEVIISSTRTSRTFNNTPTRIETIDLEEIDEKSNMKPANVSMILHESTGIQVQQTSATSGSASIRIQGLDGRYTQLLKDGYPSFGNFASGLSILEIPPLDLKQVEIIKGPASTLFGAGAIAGVVNFVSKTPKEKAAYNFIVNQSNVGQTNIGGFAMQRNKKIGYSLLALYNYQKAYDVDDDDFTELPKSTDFTIHPKLFFYPTEKATIIIGNSYSNGRRSGGDIQVINGKADNFHTYFEKNTTERNTTTFDFVQQLPNNNQLTFKTSYSYFNRTIALPVYLFKGSNSNVFGDVTYRFNIKKQTLIIGANYVNDKFKERLLSNPIKRNFTTNTIGFYAQQTWDITDKLKVENGVRLDVINYKNQNYSNKEQFFLPRISILYKFDDKWSSRLGGGLGYKTPTLFTEQTETLQYQNIAALNNVSAEKSYGATADVNFKTAIGNDFYFSINQLFFFTQINNASVLSINNVGEYAFANSNKPVKSMGFETNTKLIFKEDFKLFLGYTFTHAKAAYQAGNQFLTLLPKSKLNSALVYEKEGNFKMGLEAYFTGTQFLSNGSKTPAYNEYGFMAEKTFGKIALFINAENFTDTRQSNYKTVANLPHNNPTFDEIWNHTEGRTFNGGVKIKL